MVRVFITGGSGFIGTNLVSSYMASASLASFDRSSPLDPTHRAIFLQGDIRDRVGLVEAVNGFEPQIVVHLAARTDLDGRVLGDYAANAQGVENLIEAVSQCGSVERSVFCSSKLVCKNGYRPSYDEDYCPDTLYGESKVLGEQIVRSSDKLKCCWCIVRPTSIWGPWFDVPYRGFFLTVARKRYYHPGTIDPPKGFGYVGNVVHEIMSLVNAPAERIHKRTFYLSDYEEYTIRQWADVISVRLHGTRPRTIPTGIMRMAALGGDIAKIVGVKNPPLTSFRLRNMWQDTAGISLDSMKEVCGSLPYTMEQGVDETIGWLRQSKLIG